MPKLSIWQDSGGSKCNGALVERVMRDKPRYVGIYAPGDFGVGTYRLVIPDSEERGRGFKGAREQIVFETSERSEVDARLKDISALVGTEHGPIAVRHILNPSCNKDEGLRLIWPSNVRPKLKAALRSIPSESVASHSEAEDESELDIVNSEMADWPRRNQLIRQGKTVRSPSEIEAMANMGGLWVPNMLHLQPWAGAPMSQFSPFSPLTPVSPLPDHLWILGRPDGQLEVPAPQALRRAHEEDYLTPK